MRTKGYATLQLIWWWLFGFSFFFSHFFRLNRHSESVWLVQLQPLNPASREKSHGGFRKGVPETFMLTNVNVLHVPIYYWLLIIVGTVQLKGAWLLVPSIDPLTRLAIARSYKRDCWNNRTKNVVLLFLNNC